MRKSPIATFSLFLLGSVQAFAASAGSTDTNQVRVLRGNVGEGTACEAPPCNSPPRVEIVKSGGSSQSWSVIVVRVGKDQAPTTAREEDRSPQTPVRQASVTKEVFHDSSGAQVLLIRGSVSPLAASIYPLVADRIEFATGLDLDRIAFAVEGLESSHGRNPAMWRTDLAGPQGPMQISEAAALDVGGGDRFDLDSNKLLGRAYLSHLFARYGNWPDAIAAYNWGPGRVSSWIAAGRPEDELPISVHDYLSRVLGSSGVENHIVAPARYDTRQNP